MNAALEVLRDLRSHPLRTALSGLSVFMTVISVIAIISASAIARDVFVAQEEQIDGRAITMNAVLPQTVTSPASVSSLLDNLSTRISGHGGAFAVLAPLTATTGPLRPDGPASQEASSVTAVAGALLSIKRLPVLTGRWLRPYTQRYPPEVVLNSAARKRSGGVGALIELQVGPRDRSYPSRIVGVIADGSPTPEYYTSLASVLAVNPGALDANSAISVLAHRGRTTADTLRAMMGRALTDAGVEPTDLSIGRNDHVDELAGRLRGLQRGFLVSAAVSLVVALLGLLNIGLATVRERSRELVVRRAIGATRSRLFLLVLSVAVITALVACAVAIGLGIVAVYVVLPIFLAKDSAIISPGFPWIAALSGLVTALFTAAAGAAYPATVAARMDVAAALRD